jgi:hypothetical protein
MSDWRNDDNLLIKFGTDKPVSTTGGEYMAMGGKKIYEFDIDLTHADLSTTDAIVRGTDTMWLSPGDVVERLEVYVTEVPTGATANLDLGLGYYTDAGVLTELDYNGLLAAADFGDFGATGDVHEYIQGSTEHGALIGTVLATQADTNEQKYYFTYSEDTAAFTAGALKVRVFTFTPTGIGV